MAFRITSFIIQSAALCLLQEQRKLPKRTYEQNETASGTTVKIVHCIRTII